ncbi:MAG: hypothetical protein ACYDBP_14510 [Leptospirales bacterium]
MNVVTETLVRALVPVKNIEDMTSVCGLLCRTMLCLFLAGLRIKMQPDDVVRFGRIAPLTMAPSRSLSEVGIRLHLVRRNVREPSAPVILPPTDKGIGSLDAHLLTSVSLSGNGFL